MMADILMKALSAPRVRELREMFKLKATQDDIEKVVVGRIVFDWLSGFYGPTAIPWDGLT